MLNNSKIAGADIVPDQFKPPAGFNIILQLTDEAEATRIFNRLAESGEVTMALQKTFWSPAYAMVTDKFGSALGNQFQFKASW